MFWRKSKSTPLLHLLVFHPSLWRVRWLLWSNVTLSVGPRRRWLMCDDKQRARRRVLAEGRDGRSDESSVYLRLDSNGDGRGCECWGVRVVIRLLIPTQAGGACGRMYGEQVLAVAITQSSSNSPLVLLAMIWTQINVSCLFWLLRLETERWKLSSVKSVKSSSYPESVGQ